MRASETTKMFNTNNGWMHAFWLKPKPTGYRELLDKVSASVSEPIQSGFFYAGFEHCSSVWVAH